MKFPTLKNFLFCLELRTGGLVIGWLGVVGSVLGVIFTLALMFYGLNQFIDQNSVDIFLDGNETGTKIMTNVTLIIGIISLHLFEFKFYCSWKLLKGIENVSIIIFIVKLLPVHQLIINICLF